MDYSRAVETPDLDLSAFLGSFSLPREAVGQLMVHIAVCHPSESLLHATLAHEAAVPDTARSQTNWITFDWGSLCACPN